VGAGGPLPDSSCGRGRRRRLSPALSESSSQTAETAFDDWHYQSDGISITVEKREEGTGKNIVTYYVADVRLQSAESLRSALRTACSGQHHRLHFRIAETTSDFE
jgi:hypothetical protein